MENKEFIEKGKVATEIALRKRCGKRCPVCYHQRGDEIMIADPNQFVPIQIIEGRLLSEALHRQPLNYPFRPIAVMMCRDCGFLMLFDALTCGAISEDIVPKEID